MAKIASEADFIQCDITYDDCKDYPYIFNLSITSTARMRDIQARNSRALAREFKKLT